MNILPTLVAGASPRGPFINLVPRRRILARAQRRRMIAWAAVVAGYTAVVAVACVVLRLSATPTTLSGSGAAKDIADAALFDAQMQETAYRITTAADNSRRSQRESAELERRLDAAMTVGCHADWSLLLAGLDRVRSEEVVLESVEISLLKSTAASDASSRAPTPPRPGAKPADASARSKAEPRRALQSFALKLSGYARTPGKVFAFARDLEVLGPFENVTISQTHGSRVGSMDLTGFELAAVIAPGPRNAVAVPVSSSTQSVKPLPAPEAPEHLTDAPTAAVNKEPNP